jgi:hypothetical protein
MSLKGGTKGLAAVSPGTHVRTLFPVMTGPASFRPDLPIQVSPEVPPENPQKVRSLPTLAIPLARNFSLAFLALQSA